MSFLYPAFLLGALAIAIPIVLHLLRRDLAPEVPFTAVRLLRGTPLEQTRRRRLRDWLLLAARVTALLLLATAFSRPYVTGAFGDATLHVVAIDRSYSMGAPGRFDRALALARDAIDSAGRGRRVSLVAFDDRAEMVAAPGSAAKAREALAGLQPGHGGTRYAPLVSRIVELAEAGAVKLVVVSDMQRAGWEGEGPLAIPPGLAIELKDVGAPPANAAVVGLRTITGGIVAAIRGSGPEPLAGTARLLVDGRTVASAPYAASEERTIDVLLAHAVPPRGSVTVEIDDPDGFLADNTRHLVLDPGRSGRVGIVGDADRSGFYVIRALEAADGDDALEVERIPAGALGRMASADGSPAGVLVLLATRGLDRRAREALAGFVRAGGGLLIAASADVDPAVLATILGWSGFSAVERPAGAVVLAATDLRHPIFRLLGPLAANLGQVRFSRAWQVPADGWEVAATFSDGAPALLERRQGEGRVLLFTSDLDHRWNDFPLHPAFGPFAFEAVRHVASWSDAAREYLIGQLPPGAPPEPGVHTLAGDRRIAVNVDLRESSPAQVTAGEFSAMLQPTMDVPPATAVQWQAEQTEGRQNLWRYGLLLMLGALVAESFVGRSR